ncbi:hypothetical protein RDI58_022500 [Solanum bulbocastanum]|uniref:Uncharacterized protein n=1 Tax=Solanum bulbocastanum TaxID=147425 RepID=A0AAN8T7W2_SOLBU
MLTIREAMIYKKLTKSSLTRSANGLQLPGKEVREKLLPHISAPVALIPLVIERIKKQQVKEDLDFVVVSEIGDHDWDTIFPPNSHGRLNKLIILMQRTSKSKLKLKILAKLK